MGDTLRIQRERASQPERRAAPAARRVISGASLRALRMLRGLNDETERIFQVIDAHQFNHFFHQLSRGLE
jgi:hypothetical protein